MKLHLLTHPTELHKPTNTGRLVAQVLGQDAVTIVWHRGDPDAALLRRIGAGTVGLLWPGPPGVPATAVDPASDFILIDATWQQARKMYNRSPYLHALPTVALTPTAPSTYTGRRNQIEGGLCTLEAAAHLLALAGDEAQARALLGAGSAVARRGGGALL